MRSAPVERVIRPNLARMSWWICSYCGGRACPLLVIVSDTRHAPLPSASSPQCIRVTTHPADQQTSKATSQVSTNHVVIMLCQPLRRIRHWISRKQLETEAWFQKTTNRKCLWDIKWSHDRWRPRDPKRSNMLRAQYLETAGDISNNHYYYYGNSLLWGRQYGRLYPSDSLASCWSRAKKLTSKNYGNKNYELT